MNPVILIANFLSNHWVISFVDGYVAHLVKLPIIKSKIGSYISRFFAAIIALINLPFLINFFIKFIPAIFANHLLPLLSFINSIGAAKKLCNNLPVLWFNFFIKKNPIDFKFKFFRINIHIFFNKREAKFNFIFFKFNKSFLKKGMIKCGFYGFNSIHAKIIILNEILVKLHNNINNLGNNHG